MKKIAVILAGCGRMDGSEIHESVLTLLSISQEGAAYQCFSPDLAQDMLIESARIARGDVRVLEELNVAEFDALIIPGGNGTAYNLFTLAKDGENFTVLPVLAEKCRQFSASGKPVGFICIAPVMIPAIYEQKILMTIGSDQNVADLVTKRGALHHNCAVEEICIDEKHKIVSTPAYMLANTISEAYCGIHKLVVKVLELAN
jgi:enhancing lycopene biosynthesis protein 2